MHWLSWSDFTNHGPVRIMWNGTDITDSISNSVIVGKKINLQAVVDPPGIATSNFTWSIEGAAISNYVVASDSSTGQVLSLTQTNNSTISFYWVSGGEQSVSCTVVLTNGMKATGKAGFNVKRPTVNSFTSTTGPIVVGSSWGDLELSDGINGGTPGISFTAQITTPPSVSGQLKFTQTLYADYQRTLSNNATESLLVAPPWWLDASDPYSGVSNAIAAGTTLSMGNDDSPGIGLTNGLKKMNIIFENFSLYLMFKPSGTSIWVPLSKINWGWNGIAQSGDGGVTWTNTSGAQNPINPSGASITNFPEWSNVDTTNRPLPWLPDP